MQWRVVGVQCTLFVLFYWLVVERGGKASAATMGDPIVWLFILVALLITGWALGFCMRQSLARVRAEFHDYAEAVTDSAPSRVALPDSDLLRQTLVPLVGQYHQRLEHLRTEKSRLEVILESITEGILVTGRDGRVLLANRALEHLFTLQGDVQGRPTAEVVRQAAVQGAIDRCLREASGGALEVEMGSGSVRHLDVHVAPIQRERECIGVVTVFYDITRLRQLERMRRDFVANVSHELRTPLTAIKGYAETLADGALDDRPASERFVGIISAHADRLNLLLDDLLDLSRLESDQFRIEKTECDLLRLVESSIGAVSASAQRKHINLQYEIVDPPAVLCDPQHMEQALINLLDNAVKYTPDGGRVTVATRVADERLWVDVSDSGIGIPAADLGRIFERFYRVDKGRSRAMGGTGLGLAIVRHVVEAHGEKILVESQVGEGTTFSISLSPL